MVSYLGTLHTNDSVADPSVVIVVGDIDGLVTDWNPFTLSFWVHSKDMSFYTKNGLLPEIKEIKH